MNKEVTIRRLFFAVVVGFLFGGVDQYLGSSWPSTHLGTWTIAVSGMSAPWLALPFAFGAREEQARHAAGAGLLVTLAALAGYIALTNSPIEGVALGRLHVSNAVLSQTHVILPSLVTGPAFGWLGHRWRVSRSLASAVLVVAAFCLEPLATRLAHQLPIVVPAPSPTGVSLFEVALGLVGAVYFAWSRTPSRPWS
jgi:hypothetical protein